MLFTVIERQLVNIERELKRQTHRGAAIIAAAILEDILAGALERQLILTSRLKERLFSYKKTDH